MRRTRRESDDCPVARSLDVIGDWWSLLIIRNAMTETFRFNAFQKKFDIATNMLAARLRTLVANGILGVVAAPDGGAHQGYVLTVKGRGLFPVMVAVSQWGSGICSRGKSPRICSSTARPVSQYGQRKSAQQMAGFFTSKMSSSNSEI
jgi:DNA-binding HxlR family transcriptional regulator